MQTIEVKNNNTIQPHIFSNPGFNGTIKTKIFRQKEVKWSGKFLSVTNYSHSVGASTIWAEHKIFVPRGIEFFYSTDKFNTKFLFGADRGEVQIFVPQAFIVLIEGRVIKLKCPAIEEYANFRTTVGAVYRALLGVTRGYNQKLKTVGVGYKGALTPRGLLNITLGYSHLVSYPLDSSVTVQFSRKYNRFDLKGHNISVVHQTARDVQLFKEPDVYKGKGVRFRGKKLIKKEGKKKK